jgi:Fic-DOC domain mobile mystery protein B
VEIDLDHAPGATPPDPDEAAGLIPSHIANLGQLNEWEMTNILEAEQWAFGRRHKDLLTNEFVCRLHKRMFGKTWRWAGRFRTTEKNIGVDPVRIQPALRDLCEDVKAQLDHKSYPLDEIAARFSHRLVSFILTPMATAASRVPSPICCWFNSRRRASPGAPGTWWPIAKSGNAISLRCVPPMPRITARC